MLTACAFWMMKIITTMRPAAPAIRLVRMPLIRVCIRPGQAAAAGLAAAGMRRWRTAAAAWWSRPGGVVARSWRCFLRQ